MQLLSGNITCLKAYRRRIIICGIIFFTVSKRTEHLALTTTVFVGISLGWNRTEHGTLPDICGNIS
jgi:hypothetical protein